MDKDFLKGLGLGALAIGAASAISKSPKRLKNPFSKNLDEGLSKNLKTGLYRYLVLYELNEIEASTIATILKNIKRKHNVSIPVNYAHNTLFSFLFKKDYVDYFDSDEGKRNRVYYITNKGYKQLQELRFSLDSILNDTPIKKLKNPSKDFVTGKATYTLSDYDPSNDRYNPIMKDISIPDFDALAGLVTEMVNLDEGMWSIPSFNVNDIMTGTLKYEGIDEEGEYVRYQFKNLNEEEALYILESLDF